MNANSRAIIIFELGHLQVFCYQTIEEWTHKMPPNQVFWQKKGENIIHGPFDNIYHAVGNYSVAIASNKNVPAEIPANVINVDFKNKRRIP